MTAAWQPMPPFSDPGYDRSEWLAEADVIELMREHRAMFDIIAEMVGGAGPAQVFERLTVPLLRAVQHERLRRGRARARAEEYSDG